MFDGLRESLDRFRDDVEEEVEAATDEEAAGEDESGVAAADEAAADETAADETAAGTEAAAEAATGEAAADDAGADDAAPAEDAPEPDGAVATPGGEEPAADDGGEPDEAGSGGFARRARALARGRSVIDESDLDGPLEELELALLDNDVELSVAGAILDRVREELVGETRALTTRTGSVVEDALREALLSVVAVGQFDLDERLAAAEPPVVVIFTGVNGVGKTTTIAKVARYLEARGRSTVLANGDTYRAGATEQLAEHAEALGKKLIAHQDGGDPAAVVYDAVEYARANDVDVVLGDTAGRLHTNRDLMAQLEKIDRVVGPDLTLFVDEAVAGQDAVRRARQFDEAASIDGTILTKADADTAGGAAISIAHVTGKPILFIGTGQGYEDLDRFDPEALVDRLLGEG